MLLKGSVVRSEKQKLLKEIEKYTEVNEGEVRKKTEINVD